MRIMTRNIRKHLIVNVQYYNWCSLIYVLKFQELVLLYDWSESEDPYIPNCWTPSIFFVSITVSVSLLLLEKVFNTINPKILLMVHMSCVSSADLFTDGNGLLM